MSRAIRQFIFALLLAAALPSMAADPPPTGDAAPLLTEEGQKQLRQFLVNLRQRDPEQAERLKKLEKENPEAYRRRVVQLWRAERKDSEGNTAGVRDWPPHSGTPKPMATQPDENATANTESPRTERLGGPRKGPDGKGPGLGDKQKHALGVVMAKLRQEDPDRFAELVKLQETDPKAFRRSMQEWIGGRIKSVDAHTFGDDEKLHQLERQYQKAASEQERARLKGSLTEQLNRQFDERLEAQKTRVKQVEMQLAELRQKLTEREAQKDSIVESRLEQLLLPPDQRLDARQIENAGGN